MTCEKVCEGGRGGGEAPKKMVHFSVASVEVDKSNRLSRDWDSVVAGCEFITNSSTD